MALSPQVCLARSRGCRDLISREGLWQLPPQPSWTALTTFWGSLPRERPSGFSFSIPLAQLRGRGEGTGEGGLPTAGWGLKNLSLLI